MTNVSAWKTQEFLAQAVEAGCKYCVLEVSSHGIDQKRVANILFDVAVLTNISEEHLDYHKTLLDYANTKKKLFQWVIKNHN
jgi:UDP-N-acetylmuramoyl-L-alanyl-D-glutamate--2,6-diaminopimelate ligase